jgi:hypothetical protein
MGVELDQILREAGLLRHAKVKEGILSSGLKVTVPKQ